MKRPQKPLAQDRVNRDRQIERRAGAILERAGVREPAVDPERIARALGIRVRRSNLGENCSGVLVRRSGSAVIGVHWSHHPNRQRFSIAHELGHFELHQGGTYIDRDVVARFRDEQSGAGTEEEEIDANLFAAALLMPSDWVTRAFERSPFNFGDDSGLDDLAKRFGVSTQAMSYRLANLELLQL